MVATQGMTYDFTPHHCVPFFACLVHEIRASFVQPPPSTTATAYAYAHARTRWLGLFLRHCLPPSRLRFTSPATAAPSPAGLPAPFSMFSQRTMEQTARVNCGAPKSNRQTDTAATAHALAARRVSTLSLWVSCQAFEASVKLIRLPK